MTRSTPNNTTRLYLCRSRLRMFMYQSRCHIVCCAGPIKGRHSNRSAWSPSSRLLLRTRTRAKQARQSDCSARSAKYRSRCDCTGLLTLRSLLFSFASLESALDAPQHAPRCIPFEQMPKTTQSDLAYDERSERVRKKPKQRCTTAPRPLG